MFKKKGQAALEFLMTYGWAILAAVVVVGVLWYMIGDTGNLAGNDFQLGAPFVAEGLAVNSSGVQIEIRNGGGESMTVRSINITADSAVCTPNSGGTIANGDTGIYTIACSGLSSGDKLSGNVQVLYNQGTSTLNQTATGTIRAVIP